MTEELVDWKVTLYGSKARVTPAKGTTTPRSELNGLLILTRLLNVIVKAMEVKPRRISMFGDSECTIASVNATSTVLAPFFSNRVAEIIDTMAEWGELIDDQAVEGNDDRPRLFYQLVRYMALGQYGIKT